MKSVNTLGIALSIGMIATLGSAPEAYAATISQHHGSICQNYYPADATYIGHYTDGTYNFKSSSTYVTCPLRRDSTNDDGALTYVDIYHSTSATTACILFSYDYNGTNLGSVSGTWTGTGYYRLTLNLYGSGKSTSQSTYSVVCYLPGYGYGRILDVYLSEY